MGNEAKHKQQVEPLKPTACDFCQCMTCFTYGMTVGLSFATIGDSYTLGYVGEAR